MGSPDPHDKEMWVCWAENTSRRANLIEDSPTLGEELESFQKIWGLPAPEPLMSNLEGRSWEEGQLESRGWGVKIPESKDPSFSLLFPT